MRDSWLPHFSIRRPVTTLMIFFSFIVLGAMAVHRVPLQLLPDGFNPPFMWIWIPYTNSSPSEVEDKITKPLEESLRTLKNLDGIWSTSRNNASVVRMRFDSNTDMGLAYGEARDRVERTKPTLPEDVEEVYLQRANPNDDPVYVLGVQFDGYVDDPYYLLKDALGQKILRLPGVAKVDVGGADEKIIQVELDMARVKAHRVNLYELTQRLRQDNFTLASGRVDEGDRRYLVRSMARYPSLEAIGELPIRGDGLKLSDIATVTYSIPEVTRYFRINGAPSYALEIFKESASNTVEVCRRIDREVERLSRQYPGVKLIKFDDDAKYIVESLTLLLQNGAIGGFFAALLLFFFLRRVRLTLMITLAIPLALLITVVVMYFAGESLNIISMMGLMLSVGMLVDNSVVVVENITRLKVEERIDPVRSSIRGAGEVSLAIVMSTLTTMVVFLPSVLMTQNGMMRFFMAQLAIPLCISLAASLLVSLLFIPLWSSIVLKDMREPGRFLKWMDRVYEKSLGWANRWYYGFLKATLHRRALAMAVLALILAVTVAVPFQQVHMTEEDHGNGRNIWVGFNFPGCIHAGGFGRLHAQGRKEARNPEGHLRHQAVQGLGQQDPRKRPGAPQRHERKRPGSALGGRTPRQGSAQLPGCDAVHQVVPEHEHGRGGHEDLPAGGRHGPAPGRLQGGGAPAEAGKGRGGGGYGPRRGQRRSAAATAPRGPRAVQRGAGRPDQHGGLRRQGVPAPQIPVRG